MRRLLFVVILLFAGSATAQERQIVMEFLGFAEDGEHFVVKRYDHNIGWGFSVRSLADGAQVREHLFTPDQEEREFKRVERRYKLQEGTNPASPDGRYVALGAQDGKYFDILIMEKPRIGRFESIPMQMDGKTVRGEGMLKKAVWSPEGRHLVVIVNEKTTGLGSWERDTAYSYRFRPWNVKWFREEEEKKE